MKESQKYYLSGILFMAVLILSKDDLSAIFAFLLLMMMVVMSLVSLFIEEKMDRLERELSKDRFVLAYEHQYAIYNTLNEIKLLLQIRKIAIKSKRRYKNVK